MRGTAEVAEVTRVLEVEQVVAVGREAGNEGALMAVSSGVTTVAGRAAVKRVVTVVVADLAAVMVAMVAVEQPGETGKQL